MQSSVISPALFTASSDTQLSSSSAPGHTPSKSPFAGIAIFSPSADAIPLPAYAMRIPRLSRHFHPPNSFVLTSSMSTSAPSLISPFSSH